MAWRVYFFTFGTYGRWLHGCEKWSHSNNAGRIAPNYGLYEAMTDSLQSDQYAFTTSQRVWLHNAIYRYCIKNELIIDALNVRTNHIHLVISTKRNLTHAQIMMGLKGAISKLMHDEGIVPRAQRIWERRYGITTITYYKTWYYCVNYTLFEQGSNWYLRDTVMAKLHRIPFEGGEPNRAALRRASANERANAVRYKALKKEEELDPMEIAEDEYDVEAPYIEE